MSYKDLVNHLIRKYQNLILAVLVIFWCNFSFVVNDKIEARSIFDFRLTQLLSMFSLHPISKYCHFSDPAVATFCVSDFLNTFYAHVHFIQLTGLEAILQVIGGQHSHNTAYEIPIIATCNHCVMDGMKIETICC